MMNTCHELDLSLATLKKPLGFLPPKGNVIMEIVFLFLLLQPISMSECLS